MKQVATIIKQLQNTSGTNDKINILKANKDNELLQKVLYYTYNPYLKYGIAETKYKPTKTTQFHVAPNTIFELLDTLATSNINDLLRGVATQFIEQEENEAIKEVYKAMLFKDLKIGVNATTINKVWSGLIPTFDVMLAESLTKQKDGYLDGRKFGVTLKLDGFRCVYMPKERKFYTRQGQVYEGIDHLIEECELISQGKYVLDGELIHRNYDNLQSDELYRLTTSVARKKGNTPDKKHLEFHVFDILPYDEFVTGASKDTYEERMRLLFKQTHMTQGLDFVQRVTMLYMGDNQAMIYKLLDEVVSDGYEGLMVSLLDGVYQCKRSKNLLKVKQFHDCDVLVKDVIEGTGKHKGKLGAITIMFEHEGEYHTCDCGSGFSDSERTLYWENPSLLIDKIVTLKYFEVSKNKSGGYGLRFPTWTGRIRNDKNEISMH